MLLHACDIIDVVFNLNVWCVENTYIFTNYWSVLNLLVMYFLQWLSVVCHHNPHPVPLCGYKITQESLLGKHNLLLCIELL